MIDLLPVPQDPFHCPCGGGQVTNEGFSLPGMMPLVRAVCPTCGHRFFFHLHTGFCSSTSLAVEEATGTFHSMGTAGWYANVFENMWRSRGRPAPKVEVRGEFDAKDRDVVVVNTLDHTYGHNIARLFAVSAVRRLYPDAAIVVVCPRFMAWLVPEGVEHIWVVDAPLRELYMANDAVDALMQDLLRKARRLRYAPIFTGHPVRIEHFSKQLPFAARDIHDVLPARMTMNWREDRCWTYRGRALPQAEAVAEQLKLVTTLFERLRKEIPDLQLTVTGYGQHGRFPDWVEDLRIIEQTDDAEREWVRRYARSHVVIGVHGSNMHLPCAHAAGSIEITAAWLWNNAFDTWEWVNHIPTQIALGRYLKITESTSLSEMASVVLSLVRRMQAQSAYQIMGQMKNLDDRQRVLMHAFPAIQGGYPITVEGPDGAPL